MVMKTHEAMAELDVRLQPSQNITDSERLHKELAATIEQRFGPLSEKASNISYALLAEFAYMHAQARRGESPSQAEERLYKLLRQLKRIARTVDDARAGVTATNALDCALHKTMSSMDAVSPKRKPRGLRLPEGPASYTSFCDIVEETTVFWSSLIAEAVKTLNKCPKHLQVKPERDLVQLLACVWREQFGEQPTVKHDRLTEEYRGVFFEAVQRCHRILGWSAPIGKNVENYLKQ